MIPSANLAEDDNGIPPLVDFLKDTIIKWRSDRREQIARAEEAKKRAAEKAPKSNLS
jgi:hypothetical protein